MRLLFASHHHVFGAKQISLLSRTLASTIGPFSLEVSSVHPVKILKGSQLKAAYGTAALVVLTARSQQPELPNTVLMQMQLLSHS